MNRMRKTPYNMRLAQWGVTSKIESSCFYLALVQVDSLVLLNPPLRQAQKRYRQLNTANPNQIPMGLLDFLKINKKRNSEPENIDEIFKLAANDITYRPLFYRTILDTDLYLLTVPNEGRTEEANKVKVKNWEDGKIPIFTSTDKIFEKNIITEEENYIILKGKSVFENCPDNTTFVLNPYSTPSKEFTPSEIQKLISGELFKPDQQIPIKPGKNILISMPKENTSVIAESIRKYCTTRREISGAYLALMKDTLSEESAHLIIGLVVKGDLRQIFGELTEAIRPNIPKGEPVDMVDLNSGKNISNDLKRDEYKVY